ncbi:hypothetical protein Leryth_006086 [Lithospermum erythrorhizon]|nr:hypothetical protein Leryth_006086 [Lithospermum erythrorhizon]
MVVMEVLESLRRRLRCSARMVMESSLWVSFIRCSRASGTIARSRIVRR